MKMQQPIQHHGNEGFDPCLSSWKSLLLELMHAHHRMAIDWWFDTVWSLVLWLWLWSLNKSIFQKWNWTVPLLSGIEMNTGGEKQLWVHITGEKDFRLTLCQSWHCNASCVLAEKMRNNEAQWSSRSTQTLLGWVQQMKFQWAPSSSSGVMCLHHHSTHQVVPVLSFVENSKANWQSSFWSLGCLTHLEITIFVW